MHCVREVLVVDFSARFGCWLLSRRSKMAYCVKLPLPGKNIFPVCYLCLSVWKLQLLFYLRFHLHEDALSLIKLRVSVLNILWWTICEIHICYTNSKRNSIVHQSPIFSWSDRTMIIDYDLSFIQTGKDLLFSRSVFRFSLVLIEKMIKNFIFF